MTLTERKKKEERKRLSRMCWVPFVKKMRMLEFMKEVEIVEARKKRTQELLCFASWLAERQPKVLRRLVRKSLEIQVSYEGKKKEAEVNSYMKILLNKLNRVRLMNKRIICRLQVNHKEEWGLLKAEVGKKNVAWGSNVEVQEMGLKKLFRVELTDQMWEILNIGSDMITIVARLIEIRDDIECGKSEVEDRWYGVLEEDWLVDCVEQSEFWVKNTSWIDKKFASAVEEDAKVIQELEVDDGEENGVIPWVGMLEGTIEKLKVKWLLHEEWRNPKMREG